MKKKVTKKSEAEKKFDVKMGRKLQEFRESKHLTQMKFVNWLADNEFEKSCATISKYETGEAPIPFRLICILVKEYGIEVIEAFWGKKIFNTYIIYSRRKAKSASISSLVPIVTRRYCSIRSLPQKRT